MIQLDWQINSTTAWLLTGDHWPGFTIQALFVVGEWMNGFSITLVCCLPAYWLSSATSCEAFVHGSLTLSRRHCRAMPMDCNWLRQIWDTVGDNFHTMSFPFSVKFQCHVLLFQVRYFDNRWQALYNYINAIKRRPLWMKTKVNPSRPRARRISRVYPKRPIGYFRSRYHNDGISQRRSEFWHSRRIIITAHRYAERALS